MKKRLSAPYRHRWIYLVVALAILVGGIVALVNVVSTQPNATCHYCKARFYLPHKQTKTAELSATTHCPECGISGTYRMFHGPIKD